MKDLPSHLVHAVEKAFMKSTKVSINFKVLSLSKERVNSMTNVMHCFLFPWQPLD